jgi:predicted enzyme related to lactoylglutathione lyase
MGDAQISNPGILVVLYASDFDKKLEEVIQGGGEFLKPIYFLDPNGNELAIWSEQISCVK